MSSKSATEASAGWSLALRLTVWYALSTAVLLLAGAGYLYWTLVANLDREDDEHLDRKLRVMREILHDAPRDAATLRREVQGGRAEDDELPIAVRILDAEGRLVAETPGMADDLPQEVFPPPVSAEDREPSGVEHHLQAGRSFRLLAARASTAEGEWTVQVAFDRTVEDALLSGYRQRLWLVLGVSLLAAALVGYRIARQGLQPLADITAAARRITSATLHDRLKLDGVPAELGELTATFNAMLDRLQESFERLSRFSADIAHELRTPVNNLRGMAEVSLGKSRSADEYRDVLASCLEEGGRLARLIDSLLFLARAEHPQTQICRETVELDRELEAVRDLYEGAATEAHVTLGVKVTPGLRGCVDRTLLHRAVSNLVGNALAHTPAGGTVTLSARTAEGVLLVDVADTGDGIAPEHLPHVFDRFYRADRARTSEAGRTGLGLAIVRSIALLHGGTVGVESQPGKGTRVLLRLPNQLASG